MYAAEFEKKEEINYERAIQGPNTTLRLCKEGIVVYVVSCAMDYSCIAIISRVFIEHRHMTRLEKSTVIDGGDHTHKVEAIATMYA